MTILTSGDGSTSAKLWLPPPPSVAPLTGYKTNNMPDTTIAVGDFTQGLIGLRSQARIEVSTDAVNMFEKHGVAIKIVWRGSFALANETAFYLLTGITT